MVTSTVPWNMSAAPKSSKSAKLTYCIRTLRRHKSVLFRRFSEAIQIDWGRMYFCIMASFLGAIKGLENHIATKLIEKQPLQWSIWINQKEKQPSKNSTLTCCAASLLFGGGWMKGDRGLSTVLLMRRDSEACSERRVTTGIGQCLTVGASGGREITDDVGQWLTGGPVEGGRLQVTSGKRSRVHVDGGGTGTAPVRGRWRAGDDDRRLERGPEGNTGDFV